jgi:hypothetical protein
MQNLDVESLSPSRLFGPPVHAAFVLTRSDLEISCPLHACCVVCALHLVWCQCARGCSFNSLIRVFISGAADPRRALTRRLKATAWHQIDIIRPTVHAPSSPCSASLPFVCSRHAGARYGWSAQPLHVLVCEQSEASNAVVLGGTDKVHSNCASGPVAVSLKVIIVGNGQPLLPAAAWKFLLPSRVRSCSDNLIAHAL